jgi:hypothetical protein
MPEYDPIVICHNGNCANTGKEDDSMEALAESLALTWDGRPSYDGVEIDTFLFFNAEFGDSVCLFAHDDSKPENDAVPRRAAELVNAQLKKDVPSWNGERFYLKIELKPTVAGGDFFHDGDQLRQHAECALDMAQVAVAGARVPVTVIFDSTAECLHNELQNLLAHDPAFGDFVDNQNIEILFSEAVTPTRKCTPPHIDIRTFFVRDWHDTEVESMRPAMVWLDAHSENTETLKIIRHLRPEYVATSAVQFVRGWVEGYQ